LDPLALAFEFVDFTTAPNINLTQPFAVTDIGEANETSSVQPAPVLGFGAVQFVDAIGKCHEELFAKRLACNTCLAVRTHIILLKNIT
jgi:hypothetical protein